MVNSTMKMIRKFCAHTVPLGIIFYGMMVPSAVAQSVRSAGTTLDDYGNARGVSVDYLQERLTNPLRPRQMHDLSFQSILRGMNPGFGANLNRGTGANLRSPSFGVPSSLAHMGRFGLGSSGGGVTGGGLQELHRPMRSFQEYYGGFGSHRSSFTDLDIDSLLRRKASILAATASTAPLARIENLKIQLAPFGTQVNSTPKAELQKLLEDQKVQAPALSDQLAPRLQGLFLRGYKDAWTYFEKGEYQRAATTFRMARNLAPLQGELVVGEVFSHLSMGRLHTAEEIVGRFARHETNPFAYRLNMLDHYLSQDTADEMQTAVGLFAQRVNTPDSLALNAFVMWYCNKQDEAMRLAAGLPRTNNQWYSDWFTRMQEAQETLRAMPVEKEGAGAQATQEP